METSEIVKEIMEIFIKPKNNKHQIWSEPKMLDKNI